MVISELGGVYNDIFVFDYTGANSASGCYYFDFGQANPFAVPCTPLAGLRSAAAVTLAEEMVDPLRAKLEYVTTQKATSVAPELERTFRELRGR